MLGDVSGCDEREDGDKTDSCNNVTETDRQANSNSRAYSIDRVQRSCDPKKNNSRSDMTAKRDSNPMAAQLDTLPGFASFVASEAILERPRL